MRGERCREEIGLHNDEIRDRISGRESRNRLRCRRHANKDWSGKAGPNTGA